MRNVNTTFNSLMYSYFSICLKMHLSKRKLLIFKETLVKPIKIKESQRRIIILWYVYHRSAIMKGSITQEWYTLRIWVVKSFLKEEEPWQFPRFCGPIVTESWVNPILGWIICENGITQSGDYRQLTLCVNSGQAVVSGPQQSRNIFSMSRLLLYSD